MIREVIMKAYPAGRELVVTSLATTMLLVTCSPKCEVHGRVVEAETRQPIDGAAVAIRWYSENPSQQSSKTGTIDAVQALSNGKGQFKVPKYPDKQHILGIYKSGYICWSSKDIFSVNSAKSSNQIYRERKKAPPRRRHGD